jgi:hypothetical protein
VWFRDKFCKLKLQLSCLCVFFGEAKICYSNLDIQMSRVKKNSV